MSAIQTLKFLRPNGNESCTSTSLFFRREPWSIEKVLLLLLHWTYLIAVTFLRISESLKKVQDSSDLDVIFVKDGMFRKSGVDLSVPFKEQWCCAETWETYYAPEGEVPKSDRRRPTTMF